MATERERWAALTPAQRQKERLAAKAKRDAEPSWLERTFHAGRAKPGGAWDRTRYPNSAGNQRRAAAETRTAAAKPTPKSVLSAPAPARTMAAPAPRVTARAATTRAATSPPVAKPKAKAVAPASPRNDALAAFTRLGTGADGLKSDNRVMQRLSQRATATAAANARKGKGRKA